MLKRIYIHNYKCYVNFEQKFDSEFVFLSGRNGAGKTTLFDVFELLKKISVKGESLEELKELDNSKTRWLSGTSEQCFELDVDNEEDKYTYTLVLDNDPTQDNLYRIKREVVELNGKRIFSFEKGEKLMNNTAYLSNNGRCISFKYDNKNIRFIGPKSLERFVEVKTWDKGYLVVNAKYAKHEEPIEDYIDLNDILQKLYIDDEVFLKPIEKVEIEHV